MKKFPKRVERKTRQDGEKYVAILTDDLVWAKELSEVFRVLDIIPNIYEDLPSFWKGLLAQETDLALVDVRSMSKGELFLKNHPLVLKNEVSLGFLCEPGSLPLLQSTYAIEHYGVIFKGENLKGSLHALLARFNKDKLQVETLMRMEGSIDGVDEKMSSLLEEKENLKEKIFYRKMFNSIINRFEMRKDCSDITRAIDEVLTTVFEVKSFTYLELSPNGKRLLSPEFESRKFKNVPPLWVGQLLDNGIELFAQNMATQVAFERMGGDLMSLNIKGTKTHPEAMLILSVGDEGMLAHFEWELLEHYLSGYHSYFYSKQIVPDIRKEDEWNIWTLMNEMDSSLLRKTTFLSEPLSVIDLDFTELFKNISSRPLGQFRYNNFFRDYISRFKVQYGNVLHYTCVNEKHLAFSCVEKEEAELENALKLFNQRYPFWKYFEDADIVLTKSMKPIIRVAPKSSLSYLRSISDEDSITDRAVAIKRLTEEEELEKNIDKILWGRSAPEQNM